MKACPDDDIHGGLLGQEAAHVDLGAHDDVGLVVGLALLLAAVLPAALEGQARQQDGFARPTPRRGTGSGRTS